MGIPAIVGTGNATEVLKDDMEVTVDGSNGKVYEGKTETKKKEIKPVVETETEIKVIVDLPDFADRAAKSNVKKIGLTRMEGIIASNGMHPRLYLKEGKVKDYEEVIYHGISKIMEKFDEGWVRTSDIRTDEFKNLKGAPKEPEGNPMLGFHGIRTSLKEPDLFKAELNALRRVAENGKTMGLILPQIISVDEVVQTKRFCKEVGFEGVRIGVMVETPAASQIINELCNEGIDFISFGTNDLTQYTLAIDRNNEKVQYLYDEMHPGVLNQLAFVIRRCIKYGVETSICGQSGSKKGMVEFLVKQGIDSISVNADMAAEISQYVKELEDKGLRGSENVIYLDKIKSDKKADKKAEFKGMQAVEKPKQDIKKFEEEIKKDINQSEGKEVEKPKEEDVKKLEEELNKVLSMAGQGEGQKNIQFIGGEGVEKLDESVGGEKIQNFDASKLIEMEKDAVKKLEDDFQYEIEKSAKEEGQIDTVAEETADEVSKGMMFGAGQEQGQGGGGEDDINKLLEGLQGGGKEGEKKGDSKSSAGKKVNFF